MKVILEQAHNKIATLKSEGAVWIQHSEKLFDDETDKTISKINLPTSNNINKILKNILSLNSINGMKSFLIKNFKSYKPPRNTIKVSQNL
jgi:hypothetical protein